MALWLVAGEKRRLRSVASRMGRSVLCVSPIALVEMQLLQELGRIRAPVSEIWSVLSEDYGVQEAPGDLHDVALHAQSLSWTRDPFDRLIVAHALANGAMLLTADATIRSNCPQACWSS